MPHHSSVDDEDEERKADVGEFEIYKDISMMGDDSSIISLQTSFKPASDLNSNMKRSKNNDVPQISHLK